MSAKSPLIAGHDVAFEIIGGGVKFHAMDEGLGSQNQLQGEAGGGLFRVFSVYFSIQN